MPTSPRRLRQTRDVPFSPNSITPTSPKRPRTGKFRGSRRNGIWAKGDVTDLSRTCRARHGEVGVVEFGLYTSLRRVTDGTENARFCPSSSGCATRETKRPSSLLIFVINAILKVTVRCPQGPLSPTLTLTLTGNSILGDSVPWLLGYRTSGIAGRYHTEYLPVTWPFKRFI